MKNNLMKSYFNMISRLDFFGGSVATIFLIKLAARKFLSKEKHESRVVFERWPRQMLR